MKFHKCIPPRFSSFRYKLLLAFLIATMVPLISLTFISYHISYNIARDRIIDSAVMTDKQLVSQLNDRLGQVENVADTIQFRLLWRQPFFIFYLTGIILQGELLQKDKHLRKYRNQYIRQG